MYVWMNNVRCSDGAYRLRMRMSMKCLCTPVKRDAFQSWDVYHDDDAIMNEAIQL